MENEDSRKKISFRQKNPTICPVCGYEFYREEMLSGGGRLIAGKLTDELRRTYEKNEKWGVIYPLAYVVTVCPQCLYAAYPKDFSTLLPDELQKISEQPMHENSPLKNFLAGLILERTGDCIMGLHRICWLWIAIRLEIKMWRQRLRWR